jgi:uncharacterized protein
MNERALIDEIKQKLVDIYEERFVAVLLYGSVARGDATGSSDIDLMVVLDGDVDTGREIRRIVDTIYPVQISREFFRPIEIIPVSADDYRSIDIGLYGSVKAEGIPI